MPVATTGSAEPGKSRKKKDKVRAAWISFAGRILAQLIGAVATVMLGVYVVRTYGVARPSAPPPSTVTSASPASTPALGTPALVVLPFEVYSPGDDDRRHTDGLTEAITTEISRLADVRVVSRTSARTYKGTRKTLPAIASELHADFVVEGSVMRDGDDVRVTVQLVEAATDTHLWARTYDRRTGRVLPMYSDVATAIAAELHAVISDRRESAAAWGAGLDAHTTALYLRGRQAFARRSPGDLEEASRLFTATIARAPRFAMAHAALAGTRALMALDAMGVAVAPSVLDEAEASARQAVSLDASNVEAYLALAMVRHRRDWDWAGAEREFRRAFALHESHPLAHQWYAIFLAEQRRHEEAAVHAARAQALDPRSAPVARTAGLVHLFGGDGVRAEAALRHALDLDPSSAVSRLMLASILLTTDRPGEAREIAAVVRDPALQDQRLALMADAAARMGARADALRLQAEAERLPGTRSLVAQARFAAARGDEAGLIAVADQAVRARTPLACGLAVHPVFAPVRAHPRFQALIRTVGVS